VGSLKGLPKDIRDSNYYRVTKLCDTWFIPTEYKGTMHEIRQDGTEYESHLFEIYLTDGSKAEFRTTAKWLGKFNSFLTQEIENKIEAEQIFIKYEIRGYGRGTDYVFTIKLNEEYEKEIEEAEKEINNNKKQRKARK